MGVISSKTEEPGKNTNTNNLETFSLLWLDAEVDTSEENRQAQTKLRDIINHLKIFDDEHICQQYILSISPHDRIVFIVSGRLGRTIVPQIHYLRQILSIYIYCMDKQGNEEWSKHYPKIKAVTIRLDELISRIKQDQKSRIKIEEPISFNIYSMHDNVDQSTTALNGQFVHSLLLIDVLLRMKMNQFDKQELISLCTNQYKGNLAQLALVRQFAKKYSSKNALWWYTLDGFLYRILNKALRTQNIEMLFLFRFVMRDIYHQLKQYQCQSFVRIYRGQMMSIEEINNLQQSIKNLISINSFFSTSVNREQAERFLHQSNISDGLQRVLFEIDAIPQSMSSKPFGDISQFSAFPAEREILFMIGCVFRLIDVRQSADVSMWIVHMKLCGDEEHDMRNLFDHLKRDYGGGDDEVDILALGRVLRRMGKYDLAEKFYRRLLHEVSSNDSSLCDLYYSLGVVMMDTGDYHSSLQWLYKSLEMIMRDKPFDYVNIASRYCCIGLLYWKKKDHHRALEWYEKGIALFKQTTNRNHLTVAHLYNNIALVYDEQKKYTKALKFYQQALTIYQTHLPHDHPDIGTIHDNIGIIHRSVGHYDLAMQCHDQSLQIRQKALPSHHPLIALNYKNIGLLHEDRGDLTESLVYLQKAETIYRHSLSYQHPDVKKTEQDIQRVFSKIK